MTAWGVGSVFTVDISYADQSRKNLTATVTATGGPSDPNTLNNSDAVFVDVIEFADELFSDGFEG